MRLVPERNAGPPPRLRRLPLMASTNRQPRFVEVSRWSQSNLPRSSPGWFCSQACCRSSWESRLRCSSSASPASSMPPSPRPPLPLPGRRNAVRRLRASARPDSTLRAHVPGTEIHARPPTRWLDARSLAAFSRHARPRAHRSRPRGAAGHLRGRRARNAVRGPRRRANSRSGSRCRAARLGRGTYTDDTQMMIALAESLLEHGGVVDPGISAAPSPTPTTPGAATGQARPRCCGSCAPASDRRGRALGVRGKGLARQRRRDARRARRGALRQRRRGARGGRARIAPALRTPTQSRSTPLSLRPKRSRPP